MTPSSTYRIEDEPQPRGLAHLAVDPIWPFFAIMFGGSWLSWPWFALNSVAVGSPTKRKEILIVIVGFVVSLSSLLALVALAGTGIVPQKAVSYALLAILVWKLGITYWLHTIQGRTFELFRHFGGRVRNGLPILLIAFFAAPRFLSSLPSLIAAWLR